MAVENSDQSSAAIQKSISAAFDIFDHESNKTVDMRYEVRGLLRGQIFSHGLHSNIWS